MGQARLSEFPQPNFSHHKAERLIQLFTRKIQADVHIIDGSFTHLLTCISKLNAILADNYHLFADQRLRHFRAARKLTVK